jgi:ASC-1-like (ASCH) protein
MSKTANESCHKKIEVRKKDNKRQKSLKKAHQIEVTEKMEVFRLVNYQATRFTDFKQR